MDRQEKLLGTENHRSHNLLRYVDNYLDVHHSPFRPRTHCGFVGQVSIPEMSCYQYLIQTLL